jgi:hypothetical protein
MTDRGKKLPVPLRPQNVLGLNRGFRVEKPASENISHLILCLTEISHYFQFLVRLFCADKLIIISLSLPAIAL